MVLPGWFSTLVDKCPSDSLHGPGWLQTPYYLPIAPKGWPEQGVHLLHAFLSGISLPQTLYRCPLSSHWPELGPQATQNCREGWEKAYWEISVSVVGACVSLEAAAEMAVGQACSLGPSGFIGGVPKHSSYFKQQGIKCREVEDYRMFGSARETGLTLQN